MMLDQENQVDVEQSTTQTNKQQLNNNNSNVNPLNDHDYCSPNKNLKQKPKQQSAEALIIGISDQDQKSQSTTLTTHECIASSSSSPNSKSTTSVVVSGHNNCGAQSATKIPRTYSNDDLSDSSNSSSLSSSVASSKDLVIAQDSRAQTLKSLAPKDTPSVSKPKLGRRPLLKREMEIETGSAKQARSRRSRQNTSVTDKSEWITGEEQLDSALSEHLDGNDREKRKRKEYHDPEFSRFTSSEYSSSDAESDQESDYDSEDDPNKLWCVCNKPHGGKFMICCDICKYWYHGHCVGVTQSMSEKYEKERKEWFCPECQTQLQNGTERNAIPLKVVKKEKKKTGGKSGGAGKRGRGRPRKSAAPPREVNTRFSLRNARKSNSSIDSKLGAKKNPNKPDARSESFGVFEDTQKLKALIKERKREFFFKRSLAEQEKQAKMKELGVGRQSLTAPSLGNSLDSLASSTSTPNMNNLPINIKSEHKERSKPNIVLQINTKKDGSSDQNSQRIVTAIVKSKRKHSDSNDPIVNDLFTAEPIQINKKSKTQADTSSTATVNQAAGDATSSNGDGKGTSLTVKIEKQCAGSEQSEQPTTPRKKRKDSESSTANGSSTPIGSKQIAQKIKECLEARSKQLKDFEISPEKIDKLATDIEDQLNEIFKEGSSKYLNKYRSLVFNLRDQKNQALIRNVLSGEINPSRLVRMSAEDLASSELAKWRERENKHSIELIKRDAQLATQQVIVKKTHKGEEVISAPLPNEPDDPSAVVNNQEPPTTPTKPHVKNAKPDSSKERQSPSGEVSKSSGALKFKIAGISPDSSQKNDKNQDPIGSSVSIAESLPFLDTTKDHRNHIFDMNCKICTKQKVDDCSNDDKSDKVQEAKSSSEPDTQNNPEQQQPEQPKRFRVSIETKLDPAGLSRLKEPLIKPADSTMEAGEYSPSKASPAVESISNGEDGAEEELYDPDFVANKSHDSTPPMVSSSNEPCWSGTIMMPDVGKFSASAKPVSGSLDFMKDEISQNLMVCGRIAPDQVNSYIKRLKSTTKNQILLIQLHPLTESDRNNFDTFFDYLYSRNRCGVINNSAHPQILKDFYILPIHEKSSIPEILKPIDGPGLDRKVPNCLLGLLVRSKRPTSASSSASSYTSMPINK